MAIKNYFMINLHESDRAGIELLNPGSAVGIITDYITGPSSWCSVSLPCGALS